MSKELAYHGHNEITADKICEYLDKKGIRYKEKMGNSGLMLASFLRNRIDIYVDLGALTDADREEIEKICEAYPEL